MTDVSVWGLLLCVQSPQSSPKTAQSGRLVEHIHSMKTVTHKNVTFLNTECFENRQ